MAGTSPAMTESFSPSCPRMRASTSLLVPQDVDGRDEPGHDGVILSVMPAHAGIHVFVGAARRGWAGRDRPLRGHSLPHSPESGPPRLFLWCPKAVKGGDAPAKEGVNEHSI